MMAVKRNGVAALAVLLVVAFAVQAADDAPTDAECAQAWEDSGASDSCGTLYYSNGAGYVDTSGYNVEARSDKCHVDVYCRLATMPVNPQHNQFLGTLDEVESLNNCDGALKVGNC